MGKVALSLIGKKFSKLKVLSKTTSDKYNQTRWSCVCDCGNDYVAVGTSLNKGIAKSCGCLGGKPSRLDNKVINNILILHKNGPDGHGNILWTCKCYCGELFVRTGSHLQKGKVKSCGCRGNLDLTGLMIKNFTVLSLLYKDKNKGTIWLCKCNCGIDFQASTSSINGTQLSCGCKKAIKENLTGLRLGKLVVMERLDLHKWRCLCDCGNTFEETGGVIKRRRSCGCERDQLIEMTGLVFGDLIVKGLSGDYDASRSPKWICECKCGKIILTPGYSLRSGKTSRCVACANRSGGVSKQGIVGYAGLTKLMDKYRQGAKDRKLVWSLSRDQVKRIVILNCYFCDRVPATRWWSRGNSEEAMTNSLFISNGIDRLDNKQGYLTGNVSPCCEFCNRAKQTQSVDEFITWIKSIDTSVALKATYQSIPVPVKETEAYRIFSQCKSSYRAGAKSRSLEWSLADDLVVGLIRVPCHYCKGFNKKRGGIDRIDSTRGYTVDNILSCCTRCNVAKSNMDISLFLNNIKKIQDFFDMKLFKEKLQDLQILLDKGDNI